VAVTRKTFASPAEGVWTQAVSQAVPTLLVPILEWDQLQTNTLKLLWSLRRHASVSVDENGRERFDLRYEYGGGNVHYFPGKSHAIPIDVQEGLSSMHATPKRMGIGTSITEYDLISQKEPGSIINLASFRQRQANRALTFAMNHEIWSLPLAADVGTNLTIDTNIPIVQSETTIQNVPAIAERFTSIPMAIRPNLTGHTLQGLSSTNVLWQSKVYVGNATVQELNTTNFTAGNWAVTTAGADNIDLVTTMNTTTAIQFKAVDRVLDAMQIGGGYDVLIATPPNIYSSLGRAVWSQMRGTQADPLYEIGIRQSFSHPAYNAIFYSEPTMGLGSTGLHPNSMFFWDPDCLFLAVVENCDPMIKPWVPIPDRTDRVFGKTFWGDIVVVDKHGTGALHGVAAD
jgi:hypothetical protein